MPRPEYRKRQFNIIFPSETDLIEAKAEAKKCKISLGKYLLAMAEKGKSIDTAPHLDLIRETDQSREELAKLRADVREKSALIEKMETEIFQLRHQAFLQSVPSGLEHYSDELIKLLKSGKTWRGSDLLQALGVDPKNSDALNIITRQLQNLQDLKLVQEGSKGWKWA
jgi:hypothetical protein